jgi:hypothetical protein
MEIKDCREFFTKIKNFRVGYNSGHSKVPDVLVREDCS